MEEKEIIIPTPERIESWKKEYKTVHKLSVGGKTAYLKNPDRRTLSLAMTKIAKNDIMGGSEVLLENCWLGGDPEIKTDDELFMGAIGKVGELIQVKDAELAKL
ncbi:hypothetical protein LJB95_03235 [Paludibacteraceae bacterium OttesenSCG-928-F17]|nr:hypothetical protein [Paludibacteraceae bacterium OttesenSCG-928-F17]